MEIEQRSDEWYEARLGKATASRFRDVLATLKNGTEAATRRNYRAQLVIERLTGAQAERFSSTYMDWGTDTEDLARLTYMLKTGHDVEEVGFVQHATLLAGASPDGLIGKDGTLEIKCKTTANHIDVLKTQQVLPEYIPQIMGQLWLTGRKWCDFVSFEPTLPENAQIFIERVWRDEEYISRLSLEVERFLQEVDADVEFLRQYKARKPKLSRPKVAAG